MKQQPEKKYEPHILNLLDVEGYMAYYYQMLVEYSEEKQPGQLAWEATERAYKRYFDKEKYTSYQSFKSALSRFNKSKRKKKPVV